MTLISYHNDIAVKEKYEARFAEHRRLDQVVQGTGYDSGRGCFVGCTLHQYTHSAFETELGWPTWLAYLADRIFEGLPKEEAPQFGTDLLNAVPVGFDLSPVRHHLTIRRMDRLIALMADNKYPKVADVIATLKMTRDCAEAELGKTTCDWSAADAAAAAAAAAAARWSAADAAAAAAAAARWSAADAAAAAAAAARWSAADAAAAAAAAARWSAAAAAADADADAARTNAYRAERDDLLEVLRSLVA